MKIGILQTAYKKANEYGVFYNVQEIGLGRALSELGHTVILYKGVDGESSSRQDGPRDFTINLVSLKYFGINGLFNPDVMDPTLDVLIYFCDTQIKVPSVYSWCKKNNVKFIPYVGVIESHSENAYKRRLMDFLTRQNIRIYKKCFVLAKTPGIADKLSSLGCKRITIIPAGLDATLLKNTGKDTANQKNFIDSLLFIGRMEEEKQPLEMVRIYKQLLDINPSLKLTMIGDGYLFDDVNKAIQELVELKSLPDNQITLIRKVKYEQMADYYQSHSAYINLNKVEILGMSILEAMYYGCTVFAISAPGPRFIIKNEPDTCGFIAKDSDDLINVISPYIKESSSPSPDIASVDKAGHTRIADHFLWTSIVKDLTNLL